VAVALPSCQCRVFGARNPLKNTTLPTAQSKMAAPYLVSGVRTLLKSRRGFDRKNTIVGKVRGKAGIATTGSLAQWWV